MNERFRSVGFFDFDDADDVFVIAEKGDFCRIDDGMRLMRRIFTNLNFNRVLIAFLFGGNSVKRQIFA